MVRILSAGQDQVLMLHSGSSSACEGESGDVWAYAYEEIKKFTYVTVTVDPSSSSAGLASADSIQRAVRTSAVVKLLSRSLLTGALDPRKHLDLTAGTSLPSMQIIADLLDVIETGRRRDPMSPAAATPSGLWCINAEGLKLLVLVLSACSTAAKRKRQPLETLNEEEEPEEAAGGGDAGEKGGGGGSSAATPSRCISGGARVEKEMDVY